jgi:hypothetical protein
LKDIIQQFSVMDQQVFFKIIMKVKKKINKSKKGSGKTHTIEGNKNTEGITIKGIKEILKIQNEKNTNKIEITISFLELYNENIKDLLNNEKLQKGKNLKK